MTDSEVSTKLLKSSEFFICEAVKNAITGENKSHEYWQLAVFHLTVAIEHALKAHLAKIHPSLIRENLESKKKTVSIIGAIKRLEDDEIGKVEFSDREKIALLKAADFRNDVAHGSLNEKLSSLKANFFYLLAFIKHYHFQHFSRKLHQILPKDHMELILKISAQVKEFEDRAKASLTHSLAKYESEEIFDCAACGLPYVSIEDETYICHFCHSTDDVDHCEQCDRNVPSQYMEDFSDEFDYEVFEGRRILQNNFDFSFSSCCIDCVSDVRKAIRDAVYQAGFDQFLEDYYMDSK